MVRAANQKIIIRMDDTSVAKPIVVHVSIVLIVCVVLVNIFLLPVNTGVVTEAKLVT